MPFIGKRSALPVAALTLLAARRFLSTAGISTAMVGMLSAIPKTPLCERLAPAGRLDRADEPAEGTNVLPLAMSRAALSADYTRLMSELYEGEAYFDRLDALYLAGGIVTERGWLGYTAHYLAAPAEADAAAA